MSKSIVAFLIALCCAATIWVDARDGIIDGVPIYSMEQFPHHVTIRTTEYGGNTHYCAGSILNPFWVLTSTRCVYNGDQFELIFNRTDLNDTRSKSFSINVDNSSLFQNPYAYAALFQLPVQLKFSRYVQPVPVMTHSELDLTDRVAVMAGKGNGTSSLTYGVFSIISQNECAEVYPDIGNEICTQGYNNATFVPCWNNEGGGLLIGWPEDPTLVGIFHTPLSCLSLIPAQYVRLTDLVPWIRYVVNNAN